MIPLHPAKQRKLSNLVRDAGSDVESGAGGVGRAESIIEVKKALHRDFSGTGLAEVRLAPKAVTVIFVQAHHNSYG